MKLCTKCNTPKPETDFAHNGKCPDGTPRLRSICRDCTSAAQKASYATRTPTLPQPGHKKVCTKCLVEKLAAGFSASKLTRDGLASWCRTCCTPNSLKRYHTNRNVLSAEDLAASRKLDREARREHYKTDPVFRESCKQQTRDYYAKHRDQCIAASVSRERELCLDPIFRLNKSIRTQITQGLKKSGLKKDQRSHQYLGCTFPEFGAQLQAAFESGMSFDNYGRASGRRPYWEIGHIRPVVSFNLTEPDQLAECWHHTNLKPQWQVENIQQGAWYEGVDFKGLVASQYQVYTITTLEAIHFTQTNHYTGSAPMIATVCFGLSRKESGQDAVAPTLLGAAMWMPAQWSTAKLLHAEAPQRVLTLSRLCLVPGAPKNAASYFLGQQVRALRKTKQFSWLVSYADQAEQHDGTIYRAAGWTLHGMSVPTTRWTQDGAVVSQRQGPAGLTRADMLASGAIDEGKSQKLRFVLNLS